MAAAKTFKIAMSERCFRFKPDALMNHAPQKPGVYEFVTFTPQGEGVVLFVGLASPQTVFDALEKHLKGELAPTKDDLFASAKDVYFDYVTYADIESVDDLRDIASALIEKTKPRLNKEPFPATGRYGRVVLEEIS
jgi:hypothetical protein